MIPVMWLSAKHTNNPIPQIAYGSALLKLSEREKILATNQQEQEVRTLFKQPANEFDIKLQNLPKSWEDVRIEALHHVEELKTGNASLIETKAASRALTSFPKNIDEAKQNGLFVVGLDGESDVKINEMKVATEPLMIVVGSEGKGLSRLVREKCDLVVSIPMRATTESLNASVATSIALFWVDEQRRK